MGVKKVGILGYGYTASFFAERCIRDGYEVWGTSRDAANVQHTVPDGVEIIDFNPHQIATCLQQTSYLLISTPPTDTTFDPSLSLLEDHIIQHKKTYRWIGYLSSTGVYGDHGGAWVDEASPCLPHSEQANKRLAAEKAWLSLYANQHMPVMIYRLSGIYGPKRNALERLKAGKKTTIYKPGQYFSRIHVADISRALYVSMLSPMPGEILNVSDDAPCSAHEVDIFAAKLLHVEKPELIRYEQAQLSPMAKSFYDSNKRICNAKLKRHIVSELLYPSYKEGLIALLTGEF